MIYNYEIISNPKVNYSKSYIDYAKKRLLIKGLPLLDKNFYVFVKKPCDITYDDKVYIAFFNDRINEACKPLIKSDFGYYSVNLKEVMNEFSINKDVNVELKLEESDEVADIYEIYLN